ncbi:F0F1 ATP synthase subunit epsilon [Phaeobacter gallaeciensis]|uniref:F0F1 ATP synthase subunit epsilon n=1 Tax=Phaeobacter gallaeciensis TaxID=60890 RepID=UPI0023804016|nr:F0F1 ATP synthase subunit epsilon [Phaeobacter gallaeciensis]MDE4275265.1 F0F1 ATP synthase subunit epsilon [Phaeobacter gallaeciensis]MDE4300418.1 F0F1 ATP synthase subunit epsilon [Phaeobacter gallaeciensis]MDE5185582.1 F0F1 ATP synthase subunit epsilon [Phaeobacter gallaeciensis]
MRLKILLPDRLCLDLEVMRIVAEGPDGAFGMLPHHIDYVSQLAPGILTYEETGGQVRYAGIHSGTLVKVGGEVLVSTSGAVLGDDLQTVQQRAQADFRAAEQNERAARAALARLEAQIVRRFLELEQAL